MHPDDTEILFDTWCSTLGMKYLELFHQHVPLHQGRGITDEEREEREEAINIMPKVLCECVKIPKHDFACTVICMAQALGRLG